MNPTREEFDQLKRELQELREWKQRKEQQQIMLPLDEASLGTLNQALYNRTIDRLTVKDLRYKSLTAL